MKDSFDITTACDGEQRVKGKTLSPKRKKLIFALVALLSATILAAVLLGGYFLGWFGGVYAVHRYDKRYYDVDAIRQEQLSVHFLQSDNGCPGDCVYIKAGDTDILIDAGSRRTSARAISLYIDRYCRDGVLEYVVVTHGDIDHISGFVGTDGVKGIFERYECKTIIQFSMSVKETQVFADYCAARDAEIASGAKCYTALECCNNINGAQKVWELADGITMEILYQKYYETYTETENDHSVCLMINQGDDHYLFTGDLQRSGEESLVQCNPDLPHVTLYKAGHHGSRTSSNLVLLNKIQPQIVCICCVADNTVNGQPTADSAPAKAALERIASYTDNIYATNVAKLKTDSDGSFVQTGCDPLNGDIVVACTDGKISMYFSHNDAKLRDTEWFQQRRAANVWESIRI